MPHPTEDTQVSTTHATKSYVPIHEFPDELTDNQGSSTRATESYVPVHEFTGEIEETEAIEHVTLIQAYEAERMAKRKEEERQKEVQESIRRAVKEADKRIRWIPLLFILFHLCDAIQILASFSVSYLGSVDDHGCTTNEIQDFFVSIGVLEV